MEESRKGFSVGDYVRYLNNGVCQIVDYTTLPGMGEGMFYVLKPYAGPNASIFVPADNEKLVSRMQHILTKDEIDQLIQTALQEADCLWLPDRRARMERFHGILRDCEPAALLRLMACIGGRKQVLEAQGKKLAASDAAALKQAEGLIENEFAFSLELTGEEVHSYICACLGLTP